MFEISIYIETSLQGPIRKAGAYAVIIEYINKAGEPITRQIEGYEEKTTFHKSVLLAAVRALRRLEKKCSVVIYTNCMFFMNTAGSDRLNIWKGNEWKKSGGEDVQHKELWRGYLRQKERHDIEVRFSKHNEYRRFLQDELKQIKEASEYAMSKVKKR